jgi:hypothetical protein
VNQRPDAGDHQDHQRRQRVEIQLERHVEVARRQPHEDQLPHRVLAGLAVDRQHRGERDAERGDHRQTGDAAGDRFRQTPAEAGVDQEADERKERDQEQHVTT